MTNIRKYLFGLGFALLIMLAVVVYLPSAKKRWVRYTGAVIPNGSSTHRYSDKPFTILSVTGERWATGGRLENASAYHALVIFPIVMPEAYDGVSGGDGFTHTDIRKWRLPKGERPSADVTEEKALAIVYDAVWQTITVDSRTYQLAKGNLFVIRYDQNWQPAVTQLNATLNNAGMEEEVNAFKSVLKDDKIVQQL
jgi:hypothetical protein